MNENINLYEILKDCPENTEFYCSEIDENVKFKGIAYAGFDGILFMPNDTYSLVNAASVRYHICVNRYGSIFSKGKTPIIFPSKDQRDWSKWKCPKQKFDPKTLKPFDRVLSRYDGGCWSANLFSHIDEENNKYHSTCSFVCNGSLVRFCIPYNDDTKHLVGTKEEAPEYYRYWED